MTQVYNSTLKRDMDGNASRDSVARAIDLVAVWRVAMEVSNAIDWQLPPPAPPISIAEPPQHAQLVPKPSMVLANVAMDRQQKGWQYQRQQERS
jgi:hypothetical protein